MNISDKIQLVERRLDNIRTLPGILKWAVSNYSNVLLELPKAQLLYGRDSEGKPLTPGYLDDPYFKSTEHAQWYKSMKIRLEGTHKARIAYNPGFPEKDSNTPNLIITGEFQDHFYIQSGGDSFTIGSTSLIAPDIENKYGRDNLYRLAPLSKEYFYTHFLYDILKKHIYR